MTPLINNQEIWVRQTEFSRFFGVEEEISK